MGEVTDQLAIGARLFRDSLLTRDAQALVNHLQFEQHPHRWLIGRGDDAGHQYRRASGRRHFDFLSTVAPLFIHDFAQHAPERFVRQHVGHCTANQAAYAGLEQIFGG